MRPRDAAHASMRLHASLSPHANILDLDSMHAAHFL
jgi:hypothetical protein